MVNTTVWENKKKQKKSKQLQNGNVQSEYPIDTFRVKHNNREMPGEDNLNTNII